MILLDTHVLIWAVNNDRRLGPDARRRIDRETEARGVFVSAITPWEIALLAARGRISLGGDTLAWIDRVLQTPGVAVAPLEPAIAVGSVALPGSLHADPADRILVATARHHGWPLLTADRMILAYAAAEHLKAVDASL